ncbi:MAG: hypothetical protein ACLUFI_03025 [Oscillospiraceae bacterium]
MSNEAGRSRKAPQRYEVQDTQNRAGKRSKREKRPRQIKWWRQPGASSWMKRKELLR